MKRREIRTEGQTLRSNWLRSLSAIAAIMSVRPACCGPSVMIVTFQVSSCGTTEMARSVGNSLISSISSLIAASSSSRVFAGFFKRRPFSGWRSVTGLSASACLGRSSSTITPSRQSQGPSLRPSLSDNPPRRCMLQRRRRNRELPQDASVRFLVYETQANCGTAKRHRADYSSRLGPARGDRRLVQPRIDHIV